MKLLKIILGIILLLFILFLLAGVFTPSISYTSEVTVNKPVKEAWAVMQDESKLSQWITGFVKSELVEGTAGQVGTVSNIYVSDSGKEMIMTETIKKIEPEKSMAMLFHMDFMDMDYEMNLEPQGDKTVIKSSSNTTGNHILAKSMIALMKGGFKTQEDTNMNKLKKVIDENTTDYFPAPVEVMEDGVIE